MIESLSSLVYAPYYQRYMDLVAYDSIFTELTSSRDAFNQLLENLDPKLLDLRYAQGKWSLGEVIAHTIETEIIFTYRALTIAREMKEVDLPGFDENDYAKFDDLGQVGSIGLFNYFNSVRHSTLCLTTYVPDEFFLKIGQVDGKKVQAKSLLFIISGHCRHHLNVINERYLAK